MKERILMGQLRQLADQYETNDFIKSDPVQFVHKGWKCQQDIEIAGFIASWLAYGKREAFIPVIEEVLKQMSPSPLEYLERRRWVFSGDDAVTLYRFYKRVDLYDLFEHLYSIYFNFKTMENAVYKHMIHDGTTSLEALISLFSHVKGVPQDTKSACKRLNMFLRWMVRKCGPVDIGIWTVIDASNLLIPLDTHVARIARQLGLLEGTSNNMRAVIQLTDKMRKIFPNDPARADFALFGYGVTHPKE